MNVFIWWQIKFICLIQSTLIFMYEEYVASDDSEYFGSCLAWSLVSMVLLQIKQLNKRKAQSSMSLEQ